MKVLALLPVAAAGMTLLSSHTNLDKMRESLIQLANDRRSGKIDKITEETAGNIRTILNNLNDTLATALDADRINAQALLDTDYDAVEQCMTDRTSTFSGSVATKNTSSMTAANAFHTCKDGNAFIQFKRDGPTDTTSPDHNYGYNFTRAWNETENHPHPGVSGSISDTTHELHAHGDQKTKCDALDNLVKSFDSFTNAADSSKVGLKAQPNPLCQTPDEDDKFDIFDTDDHMITTSFDYFKYMDAFEAAHAADYKEKRRQCHEARHRQQIRVAECHRLQHLFEGAYCLWANTIEETCDTYKGCYEDKYSSFTSTNSSVADMEVTFKLQQHALEILLCYGDQILQDSTNLSECDDQACTVCNSGALDIVYTDPHSEESCSESVGDNKPCNAGWCGTYYGEYMGSDIPVDDCVACAEPSLQHAD